MDPSPVVASDFDFSVSFFDFFDFDFLDLELALSSPFFPFFPFFDFFDFFLTVRVFRLVQQPVKRPAKRSHQPTVTRGDRGTVRSGPVPRRPNMGKLRRGERGRGYGRSVTPPLV